MERKLSKIVILFLVIATLLISACSYNKPVNEKNTDVIKPILLGQNASLDNILLNEGNSTEFTDIDPDENVWAIVEIKGDSLIDYYLKQNQYSSFPEFVTMSHELISTINNEQNEVKAIISDVMDNVIYKHTYNALFNGFSLNIKYSQIAELKKLSEIKSVTITDEYYLYNNSETEFDSITDTIRKGTGVYNNNTEFKGEGMLIAVIDSGVDYKHPAFQNELNKVNITYEQMKAIGENLKAINPVFDFEKSYVSSKIPFMFDYADMDCDACPGDDFVWWNGGEHGTHVAGIIAGNDSVITGSAPYAQLAVMKVADDANGRINNASIAAALNDCAILGVDVINMSLGTPGGFTHEEYESLKFMESIHEKLYKLGIDIITSVGNSANTSAVNKGGHSSSSNPDNGVTGSPASYNSSFSVGSIETTPIESLNINGQKYSFGNVNNSNYEMMNFVDNILGNETELKTKLVLIPNAGLPEDYENIDVQGKIALVKRGGGVTFKLKQFYASEKGAKGIIIYNNVSGSLNISVNEKYIPTCVMTLAQAEEIIAQMTNNEADIIISTEYRYYPMSSFSSWGTTPDLKLKPDMVAAGGNIYSSVPVVCFSGMYAYMSGTSMSTPNLTGIIAAMKQSLMAKYPEKTNKEIQALTYQLLMSTADILLNGEGNPYSPRQQGAGYVNFENALNTEAFLSVTGSNRVKLELGDDKTKDGIYTLVFNVNNISDESKSFNMDISVLTEQVIEGKIQETSRVIEDCKYKITVKNGNYSNNTIVVDANTSAQITIVITLSEATKEELNNDFENGIFIEGFVKLNAIDKAAIDLSIPYVAFYGDWTMAPIFDKSSFDTEEANISSSDIYTQYNDNYYTLGNYSMFALPEGYEMPEISMDRIAISGHPEAVNNIYTIQMALLRSVKELWYYYIDAASLYVYNGIYGFNIPKAFVQNGNLSLTSHDISMYANENPFANNQKLELIIEGILDIEGVNKAQSVSYPIYIDSEAPTLISSKIRYEDGKVLVDLNLFDNHYMQCMLICSQNKDGETVTVYDNAIPVYKWNCGENNTITLDITDKQNLLYNGELSISLIDYAYNQSTWYIGNIENQNSNNENSNNINAAVAESNRVIENQSEGYFFNYIENDDNVTLDVEGEDVFTVENGVLVAYSGKGGDIVIPDNLGITAIGCSNKLFTNRTGITSIVIPEGVTILNENSINSCIDLLKVVLPKSLTTIERQAFNSSSKLESINLEDTSVNFIGDFAFAYCDSIKELIYPDTGMINMGSGAMLYMEKLEKLVFNGNVSAFIDNVIAVCPNLKEVVFMKDFGGSGGRGWVSNFASAKKLEKLEFHGNVGEIGKNSYNADFSGIGVKEIYFYGNVEGITGCNFTNCPNLEKVVFGGKVGKISRQAFSYCPNLKNFTITENNTEMLFDNETKVMYNKDKTSMMIPGSWDYDGVFTIPETITELEDGMFSDGTIYMDSFTWKLVKGDGWKYLQPNTRFRYSNSIKTKLNGVILPDSITYIPQFAFAGNTNLKEISYNSEILGIGYAAFMNCYSLKGLKLTDALTELDTEVFEECRSLEEIYISNKITELGEYLFSGCYSLKKVNIDNITVIGDDVFYGCKSITSLAMNNELIDIGNEVFMGCEALERIALSQKLTYISDSAFNGCKSLTSIDLQYINEIGENAFNGCEKLSAVNNTENLEAIGGFAFANTSIVNISFSEKLTDAELNTVFSGNRMLQEVNISENNTAFASIEGVIYTKNLDTLLLYPANRQSEEYTVNEKTIDIAPCAFNNCVNLNVIDTNNAVNIGIKAFEDSSIATAKLNYIEYVEMEAFNNAAKLTSIEMPVVIGIDEYAFNGTAIKEVTIYNSLEYVSSYAFANCSSLKTIILKEKSLPLDFAFIFFNTTIENIKVAENAANYTMENGILYNEDKTVIYKALSADNKLVISEGVVKVSAFAFMNIANIESIEFPTSMKAIGDKAFYGCNGLKELTFKSEKAPMLECMINENQYYYSNFVTEIGNENLKLTVNHVDNASYNNFIWTTYFAVHNIIAK